jgi:hypothetical protein
MHRHEFSVLSETYRPFRRRSSASHEQGKGVSHSSAHACVGKVARSTCGAALEALGKGKEVGGFIRRRRDPAAIASLVFDMLR